MNINRFGALNLFAAFDTRTGKVWGQTYERKRSCGVHRVFGVPGAANFS